eukprot:15358787-Ditylum_brightwellii.AAC.1
MFSKLRLNTIKFDNEVYMYLQKHSVYVQQDMFKRNNIVSPGILTNIHPTLTHKDDLVESMQEQLKQCKVPNTEVCTQWLKDNAPDHKKEENVPVPEFRIATAKAAWGTAPAASKQLCLNYYVLRKTDSI